MSIGFIILIDDLLRNNELLHVILLIFGSIMLFQYPIIRTSYILHWWIRLDNQPSVNNNYYQIIYGLINTIFSRWCFVAVGLYLNSVRKLKNNVRWILLIISVSIFVTTAVVVAVFGVVPIPDYEDLTSDNKLSK